MQITRITGFNKSVVKINDLFACILETHNGIAEALYLSKCTIAKRNKSINFEKQYIMHPAVTVFSGRYE